MLKESDLWQTLRKFAIWLARVRFFFLLMTTIMFPVFEGIFINLLTGAKQEEGGWLAWVLVVIVLFHVVIAALLLFSEASNPITNIVNALETEEAYRHVQNDLKRRHESLTIIRSIIDTLNLQTCQHLPSDALRSGIEPIMQRVICGASTILGTVSNRFTLEVYFHRRFTWPMDQSEAIDQVCFYSPEHIEPSRPSGLEQRSPIQWGLNRAVGGICRIENDKDLFYQGGAPASGIYFRQFATVPIKYACSEDVAGLFVLTSMQSEAFAEDVLDTMQFIASILSQFLAYHNRCMADMDAYCGAQDSSYDEESDSSSSESASSASA